MKAIVVALFFACVFGSSLAQDCSAKAVEFHKCIEASKKTAEDAEKAKWEALKPKFDACFTDNGCTPPAGKMGGNSSSGEKKGNNTEAKACKKAVKEALKTQFDACIQKAGLNITLPKMDEKKKKDGKGKGKKDHEKALEGCAKKDEVIACKRALKNSTKPTDDEKKARFQAKCDAKTKCLADLGADCQAQLEKFKMAACQCKQEIGAQKATVRSSTPACSGVPEKKSGEKKSGEKKSGEAKSGEKKTCEAKKDYCKLGYDAKEADEKAKKAAGSKSAGKSGAKSAGKSAGKSADKSGAKST